jgi:predicted aspartyl protease
MPHPSSLPRRGLLALAPLLAARCAALPTQSCSFAAPNPVPLAIVQALPYVAMTVNGWPVTALFDTGAERTLVVETLLPGLGLPYDPRRQAYQTGATGRTAPRPIATLPRLSIGTAVVRNLEVGVIERPGLTGPDGNAPQIILGGDVLGQHDLDIDLPARRLILHPAQRCRLDAAPLPGPTYELPMRIRRARIMADVTVNGRPAEAMLDTGANAIQLSRARAASFGVTEAELAGAPQRSVRGINNEALPMSLVRLDRLGIGPELHRNVPVLVGDLPIADIMIGTPWLGNRRLFASYVNERLFVLTPPGLPTA